MLRTLLQILATRQLSLSIRRMQCSLFLLLLILAPAFPDARLEGLCSTVNCSTQYHVSALLYFFTLKQKCGIQTYLPQKHQKPLGRPLKVFGELNLRNIQGVDDAKMVISLEISLRYLLCSV